MNNDFKIGRIAFYLGLSALAAASQSSVAMTALDEHAMSEVTGQAAFYTTYTAPSGSGTGSSPSDYGFFTLGVQSTVQLNANIDHLQLGCGGVNGSGCDIDINQLSLSGAPVGVGGNPNSALNPGAGTCPSGATSPAACDAVLTNPFIRLAIANPNSLSTRQVVGLQLGAQNISGLLQSGQNSTTGNGINDLSGYVHVQSTSAADTLTGTINTASINFPVNSATIGIPNNASPGYIINGTLNALSILGLFSGATVNFQLTSGTVTIPAFTGINFSVAAPTINGTRVTGITVNPSAGLPDVILGYNPDDSTCGALGLGACNQYGTPAQNSNFSQAGSSGPYPVSGGTVGTQGGPVNAQTTSCSGLGCLVLAGGGVGDNFNVHLYGLIHNIQANVAFTQPLGFIHSLVLNSPGSLSLQSQPILWPGSPSGDVAQNGWWLSVNNPVYLGNLVPSNAINLCADPTNTSSCVFQQFASQFNAYLKTNPPTTNSALTLLAGQNNPNVATGIQIGQVTLSPIMIALNGVQLASQNTVPNCYGGLHFC